MSILAVTGLAKEARIAKQAGLVPVVGACDETRLAAKLEALPQDIVAVVSFGIAGSLSPLLHPGDVVVASHVVGENEHYVCDPDWARILRGRLFGSQSGIVAGVGEVVGHISMKKALMQTLGAHAVDMESHIAARFAKKRGLPLAALRAISDPHNRTLPPAALVPLGPNGKARLALVLKSLIGDPGQFFELVQTGREAGKAFRALVRARRLLGPGLGCPYRG